MRAAKKEASVGEEEGQRLNESSTFYGPERGG